MAEIDSSGWGSFSHGWAREPSRIVRQPLDANLLLPWLLKKVSAGETVIVPRLDDQAAWHQVQRHDSNFRWE
jgi:hypothetical protein